MRAANPTQTDPDLVQPGSVEAKVIAEELELLVLVQKSLAEREIGGAISTEYDRELIALRDQISEARAEDIAPLVAEMYRLQALGARTGSGRTIPVDVQCPYFGHLTLNDGKKSRDVLIGNAGYVPSKGKGAAIVDWRNAPVSRIYYRYEEGDDFEEDFGGRISRGIVAARRTVTINQGELRRVMWAGGAVARRRSGDWVRISVGQRPTLQGGAGTASRPPTTNEFNRDFKRGKLGVVGDESLREDKRLQAITGLIDKQQFDVITKPDSGIVILQGGAGSGKTTVALHRAAYLHYDKPQVFSPKKMQIVVRSPALTEYIARVLPSLGVPGLPVVTLENWMHKTRMKVLPRLKRPIVDDVPSAVARLKKHPAILHLLECAVNEEAEFLGSTLVKKGTTPTAKTAIRDKWTGLVRLALLPRIREMQRWLDSAAAGRAGITPKARKEAGGALRRARSSALDIESTWSQVLTDREMIAAAVEERTPGEVTAAEIDELVRWVGQQAEEVEDERDEDERDEAQSRKARREAEGAVGLPEMSPFVRRKEDDGVGVDGRRLDDDSPMGKFDEHDDALLLRLLQLKVGALPIPGTDKTVAYEHVVVDEAQDLSPTDVMVLKGALTKRQSMTLAGDTAQKLVFDNGFTDWKDLMDDLGINGLEVEPLRISYRSTREVMDFSTAVLGPLADPIPPVATRSGAPVEQFTFGTTGEAMAFVGESLRSLMMRERRASIAVIARYGAQADIYYEGLKNAEVPALRRVYGKEFTFAPGIDVVDVAQIKGLEYDYVILVEVNQNTYPAANEARHLLHIASTRAVYQLWVTSVATPSPLLPDHDL